MKKTAFLLMVLLLASCAPAPTVLPPTPMSTATATRIVETSTPTTTPLPSATPLPPIAPDLLTQTGLGKAPVFWQDEATGYWFAGENENDGKLMLGENGQWVVAPTGFAEFLNNGGHWSDELNGWVLTGEDGADTLMFDQNLEPIVHAPELTTYTLPLTDGTTWEIPGFYADLSIEDERARTAVLTQDAVNRAIQEEGIMWNYQLALGDGERMQYEVSPKLINKKWVSLRNVFADDFDNSGRFFQVAIHRLLSNEKSLMFFTIKMPDGSMFRKGYYLEGDPELIGELLKTREVKFTNPAK